MLATRSEQAAAGPAIIAADRKASAAELRQGLLAGLGWLVLALPIALFIAWAHRQWPDAPARAVTLVCALFALVAPLPALGYFALRRGEATVQTGARIALITMATLIAGITLYVLGTEVFFPGDFLVWSESDFVNDILKLRIGYPIYSAQANNESFFYPPGAQALTYLLSALAGHPASVVAYRLIQIAFTVGAALLATACVRELLRMTSPPGTERHDAPWLALSVPVLFLAATNSLTNAYVQNLHNDSLAQLVCVIAFWLLLRYARTRSLLTLGVLALIPCFGFFVKQSLLIWAPLTGMFLLLFDRPRSFVRVIAYSAAALAGVALLLGAGRLLWGDSFGYWFFHVLKAHAISPLRSVQHVIDAWVYFALVIVGGLVLLTRGQDRRVLGVWLVALLLLTTEAYTSGAAWMLNHMGPGSLLAATWFMAAAGAYWSDGALWSRGRPAFFDYGRAALVVAVALLVLIGMSTVRIPLPSVSPDAYRYVAEIEREFQGEDPKRVLLDVGTWVYLPGQVIMRDRSPTIGERGYSASGDFAPMIDRLQKKQYAKILVREPFARDSWYEHADWPVPSGIAAALRENYHEVRTIPAVSSALGQSTGRYTFRAISVLVPNTGVTH
jgi:hypothetical protein